MSSGDPQQFQLPADEGQAAGRVVAAKHRGPVRAGERRLRGDKPVVGQMCLP